MMVASTTIVSGIFISKYSYPSVAENDESLYVYKGENHEQKYKSGKARKTRAKI